MEIVLIRHGEPEWVRDGLAVVDPPLTDRGHRQADRLAAWLSDEHFDEVLVSPLVRARQTAAPLLEALGSGEVIDSWLEEIRDPMWHGSPAEKAGAAYAELKSRAAEERWHGLDGGESIRAFVARIRAGASGFLEDRGVVRSDTELPVWQIAEPGARIALVAHAGGATEGEEQSFECAGVRARFADQKEAGRPCGQRLEQREAEWRAGRGKAPGIAARPRLPIVGAGSDEGSPHQRGGFSGRRKGGGPGGLPVKAVDYSCFDSYYGNTNRR